MSSKGLTVTGKRGHFTFQGKIREFGNLGLQVWRKRAARETASLRISRTLDREFART